MASIYRNHSVFGGALLRAVEGAVRGAFNDHTAWGIKDARVARSITKRVVGMVGSHWDRLSDLRAKARGAVRLAPVFEPAPATAAGDALDQSQTSSRQLLTAWRADGVQGSAHSIRAAEVLRIRRRGMETAHRCIGAMLVDLKQAERDGADPFAVAVRREALVDALRVLRRLIDGESRPSVEWRGHGEAGG